jgi:hypothetical protein
MKREEIKQKERTKLSKNTSTFIFGGSRKKHLL